MKPPRVRLRYVGLLSLVASIAAVGCGALFSLIVSRRLQPWELGEWRYISSIFTYFLIPLNVLNFWTVRYVSRGFQVYSTVALTGLLAGVFASLSFHILSPLLVDRLEYMVIVVASLQLFTMFMAGSINSLALGFKPQVAQYGAMSFEIIKTVIAYLLVLLLRMRLVGAFISVTFAFVAKALIEFLMLRDAEWKSFNPGFLKDVIRLSWLPLYSTFVSSLASLDVIIVTALLGETVSIGFWTAAFTIGNLPSIAWSLSAGLYPRLLREVRVKDVELSTRLVYMLSTPIMLGVILIAEPLLNILRPEYTAVWPAASILAVNSYILGISLISSTSLMGSEDVELKNKAFKPYLKSVLFKLPSLKLVKFTVYLAMLVTFFSVFKPDTVSATVTLWAAIRLLANLPFSLFVAYWSAKRLKWSPPFKQMGKYLVLSLFMVPPVLLTKPHSLSIQAVNAFLELAPSILLGASVYLGLLYVFDREFRSLVWGLLRFLRTYYLVYTPRDDRKPYD